MFRLVKILFNKSRLFLMFKRNWAILSLKYIEVIYKYVGISLQRIHLFLFYVPRNKYWHVFVFLIDTCSSVLQVQPLLSLYAEMFCVCFTVRLMGAPAAVPSPNLLNIPQVPLPVKPGVRWGTTLYLTVKYCSWFSFRRTTCLFFLPVSRSSTHTQSLWWSAAWLWTLWREAPRSRTALVTFLMKGSTHRCMRGPLPTTRTRPAAPTTQRLLSSMPPPHPPPQRMKRAQARLPSEFSTTLTLCCCLHSLRKSFTVGDLRSVMLTGKLSLRVCKNENENFKVKYRGNWVNSEDHSFTMLPVHITWFITSFCHHL